MALTPQEQQELAELEELESLIKEEAVLKQQLAQRDGVSRSTEIEPIKIRGPEENTSVPKQVGTEFLRGTMRGGAQTAQGIQNLIDFLTKPSRATYSDGGVSVAQPEQGFFGRSAERALEFAKQLPETRFTKSVPGLLTKAAPEAAQFIGRVGALGGGSMGLGLEGAIQAAPEGAGKSAEAAATNIVLGKLLQAVGAIKPAQKVISQTGRVVSRPAPGMGTLTGLTRAGLGGAIFATPTAVSGGTPEEVTAAGLEGALLSAPRTPGRNIPQKLKSAGRWVQRIKSRPKILEQTLTRRQAEAETGIKLAEGITKEAVGEELSGLEQTKKLLSTEARARQESRESEISRLKQKEPVTVEELASQQAEIRQFDESSRIFERDVTEAIEGKALELQESLPVLFASKGKQYKQILEPIEERINKDPNLQIKVGDALEIYQNALNTTKVEAGIDGGRSAVAIQEKIEKTLYEHDASGRKIMQVGEDGKRRPVERDLDESIPFNVFVQDARDIRSTINWQKRASAQELPAFNFMKLYGDLLAQRSGGDFPRLQQAYSVVMRAMNRLTSEFKPFAGEFKTEPAEVAIRKILEGKAGGGLKRARQFVEEGAPREFAGGLGKVFESLETLMGRKPIPPSKTRQVISQESLDRIKILENEITEIQRDLSDKITAAESGVKKTTQAIEHERDRQINKILNELQSVMKDSRDPKTGKILQRGLENRIKEATKKVGKLQVFNRAVRIALISAGGALVARAATTPIRNIERRLSGDGGSNL